MEQWLEPRSSPPTSRTAIPVVRPTEGRAALGRAKPIYLRELAQSFPSLLSPSENSIYFLPMDPVVLDEALVKTVDTVSVWLTSPLEIFLEQ